MQLDFKTLTTTICYEKT